MMYYLNSAYDESDASNTDTANNDARDAAQAAKFEHYLNDRDEDVTLVLAPFDRAALPFEILHPLDGDDAM